MAITLRIAHRRVHTPPIAPRDGGCCGARVDDVVAFQFGRSAAEHVGTEALLFQTGYLTITGEEELGARRCTGWAIRTGRCGRA